MTFTQQATTLAQQSSPLQTIFKPEGRYFYFPELQTLGLEHYLSSVDQKLMIDRESSEMMTTWQHFLDLMSQPHQVYYFMKQVHSDRLEIVDELGLGEACGLGRRLTSPDGLATARPDFLLSSSFADCAPVLLYAPEAGVQANIHSGWRGTLANIAGKAVSKLCGHYQVQAHDFYAAIGPHIGREDFEVDLDVAEAFRQTYPDLTGLVRPKTEPVFDPRRPKFLIDLNLCLIYNLLLAGLQPEHIFSAHRSTVAHPEDYHSYRRDRQAFNLMMVISQISRK